jgi:periplasmic protein CpxP/Spy
MSKLTLVSLVAGVLLLINLLLAGILFFKKPERHHPPDKRKIIIERLRFDQQQEKDFENLVQIHRSEIRSNDEAIRELKNQLYATLILERKIGYRDSILAAIGKRQINIELAHFKHFQEIQKLCRPDQIRDFEAFSQELSNLFSPPRPPRHPN